MISPQAFVNKIWECPPNKVIELPEELQKSLEMAGNTELEAIALAEKMMPRIRALVSEKIQTCKRKRLLQTLGLVNPRTTDLSEFSYRKKKNRYGKSFITEKLYALINNLKGGPLKSSVCIHCNYAALRNLLLEKEQKMAA